MGKLGGVPELAILRKLRIENVCDAAEPHGRRSLRNSIPGQWQHVRETAEDPFLERFFWAFVSHRTESLSQKLPTRGASERSHGQCQRFRHNQPKNPLAAHRPSAPNGLQFPRPRGPLPSKFCKPSTGAYPARDSVRADPSYVPAKCRKAADSEEMRRPGHLEGSVPRECREVRCREKKPAKMNGFLPRPVGVLPRRYSQIATVRSPCAHLAVTGRLTEADVSDRRARRQPAEGWRCLKNRNEERRSGRVKKPRSHGFPFF